MAFERSLVDGFIVFVDPCCFFSLYILLVSFIQFLSDFISVLCIPRLLHHLNLIFIRDLVHYRIDPLLIQFQNQWGEHFIYLLGGVLV